ncbi:hypothetical protein CEXT_208211 [Caerostris extrusa]|uniref:Uncharacterized protein n=1 Tax=Caerostris extrusa TaxID=172846 RepID=A0AAV4W5B3_CAEEX|nr:hypothetical protein CEXT_208211 [Caerostris extrusa]
MPLPRFEPETCGTKGQSASQLAVRPCEDLRNSGIDFFVNTLKSQRSLKVIIKGLHVNTSNFDIGEALTFLLLEISSVTQLPNRRYRQDQPALKIALQSQKKMPKFTK